MRRAAPVAPVLPIASSGFLRSVPKLPSAPVSPVLAARPSESCQMDGNRFLRPQAAGSAAASSEVSGCRGSAPTEAPHTRSWRRGPGAGRSAAGGAASGPAITTAERCFRWLTTSRKLTTVAGQSRSLVERLRTFLELSIDGTERAASIIRLHSCAWQAVSASQARSCGSSSRPSGVIRRSPRKEKPAQGPVKSIRWCGSNSIMPRSHPWPGSQVAGKSRARGPAIATRSRRRRTSAD